MKTIRIFLAATFLVSFSSSIVFADELVRSLTLPKELGQVLDRIEPTKGNPTVVCILDAHCDVNAQFNIAKILDGCYKRENIYLVGVEGATGVVDVGSLEVGPKSKLLESLWAGYIRDGLITGAEYYASGINPRIVLYGVEDGALYLNNLNAYRRISSLSPRASIFIEAVEANLKDLYARMFSKELKELNILKERYLKEEVPVLTFIDHLAGLKEISGSDWTGYDQVLKLLETEALGKKIDFKAVKKEMTRAVSGLEETRSKKELQELMKISLQFRFGEVQEKSFYLKMREILSFMGSDPSKYENFSLYVRYLQTMGDVDQEILFYEIDEIVELESKAMMQTSDEFELYMLKENLLLARRSFAQELSRHDLEKFRRMRHRFYPERIISDTKGLLERNGYDHDVEKMKTFSSDFEDALNKADKFYELAVQRDRALLENLLREMHRRRQEKACMIVGGFHKSGIISLAKEMGVGIVVITPNISGDDDKSVYQKAITGVRFPLTKQLNENRNKDIGVNLEHIF